MEVNDIKNSFERGEPDSAAVLVLRRHHIFITLGGGAVSGGLTLSFPQVRIL